MSGWPLKPVRPTGLEFTDSDILSASAQPSNEVSSSISEWILFSPHDEEETTSLTLPTHNGSGSFRLHPSEVVERVNAWQIEQSKWQANAELTTIVPFHQTEPPVHKSRWQLVKQGIEWCIQYDDKTIDALFCRDFDPKRYASSEPGFWASLLKLLEPSSQTRSN